MSIGVSSPNIIWTQPLLFLTKTVRTQLGAASDNEAWKHHSSENLKLTSVRTLQLGCDVLPAKTETTNMCAI